MTLLAEALATPSLVWIVFASIVAGIVRGFSGFGTAMIFLPVAGQFLSPFQAMAIMLVMDFFGPLPNVPRALRDGQPGEVARLGLGLFIGFPFGVWLLTLADPHFFRYAVSLVTLALILAMATGLRYRGKMTTGAVYGVGLTSGLLGGVSGLPGPPMILFYMASPYPVSTVRANILVCLLLSNVALLLALALQDLLDPARLVLGACLVAPYLLANLLGAAIFRPGAERTYRAAAYVIIGISAIRGLPVWG